MILLFLAEGFEEIEAITIIDIVRRAGLEIKTLSVTNTKMVKGAHDICIMADDVFKKSNVEGCEMMILPGGMPGTKNLGLHEGLRKALVAQHNRQRPIAAICAAPSILGKNGILAGRKATCYPGFEEQLIGAELQKESVVRDGHIITGSGPASAADFAFEIVRMFLGQDRAEELQRAMLYVQT